MSASSIGGNPPASPTRQPASSPDEEGAVPSGLPLDPSTIHDLLAGTPSTTPSGYPLYPPLPPTGFYAHVLPLGGIAGGDASKLLGLQNIFTFVVYYFSPPGSVLRLDSEGRTYVVERDTILKQAVTCLSSWWFGKNGDQVHRVKSPIEEFCATCDKNNKNIAYILYIVYEGILQAIKNYNNRERDTVCESLNEFAVIVFAALEKFTDKSLIPSNFFYNGHLFPRHSVPKPKEDGTPGYTLPVLPIVNVLSDEIYDYIAKCLVNCMNKSDDLVFTQGILSTIQQLIDPPSHPFSQMHRHVPGSHSSHSPYPGRRV